jgi:hypothetical protein
MEVGCATRPRGLHIASSDGSGGPYCSRARTRELLTLRTMGRPHGEAAWSPYFRRRPNLGTCRPRARTREVGDIQELCRGASSPFPRLTTAHGKFASYVDACAVKRPLAAFTPASDATRDAALTRTAALRVARTRAGSLQHI